jgi:hypothetical protein
MKGRLQSSSTRIRHSKLAAATRAGNWRRAGVLQELKRLANPKVRAKMAHFGVHVPKAHGISAPVLHSLAQRMARITNWRSSCGAQESMRRAFLLRSSANRKK